MFNAMCQGSNSFVKKYFWLLLLLSICIVLLLFKCPTNSDISNSISICVSDNAFTITDATGNELVYSDSFSGSLEPTKQQYVQGTDKLYGLFYLEVPYSKFYSFRAHKQERLQFGIASMNSSRLQEYSVSGIGIEEVTLSFDGQITLSGHDMDFTVFLSMPCDELGDRGCLRFYGTAGKKAFFRVRKDKLVYSGITPGHVSISYAGLAANSHFPLEIKNGDGQLDISEIIDSDLHVIPQ